MLQSVQRLERRGGFRPRLFETRRDYLRFMAMAQIQGVQAASTDEAEGPLQRLEGLLRRAVHRADEMPE